MSFLTIREKTHCDLRRPKKITIEFTDLNAEKILITLNKKDEFIEFSELLLSSLEKEVKPNHQVYSGKDIVTCKYDSYEVEYMIGVAKNREVHIRVYSSPTERWVYGRYKFDGLIDFI